MAPNPHVAAAFKAMKILGISEVIVKPVLKKLLKLFDNKWDFIEADNYQALVDAIFEQEGQVAQPESRNVNSESRVAERRKRRCNEDIQVAETRMKIRNVDDENDIDAETNDDSNRPLKRLRLRYQDNHVSSSSRHPCPTNLQPQPVNNSQALIIPKDEPESLPFNSEKRNNGGPDSSHQRISNLKLTNSVEDSSSNLVLASTESGQVKISLTSNFHMPSLDELFKTTEDRCLKSYKFLDPSFSVRQILSELCRSALELGSSSTSSQEEMNVSPSYDPLSKSIPMDVVAVTEEPRTPKVSVCPQDSAEVEETGTPSFPLTSNGMCHTQDSSKVEETRISLPPISNEIGNGFLYVEINELNCLGADNDQSCMEKDDSEIAEHVKMAPLQTRSATNVVDDISKGLENVSISVINEVNQESPPAFMYIPSNIVFESANVNLSLARIGGFCSTCIGDCVSNPCACGDVAYTVEGVIKEEFLEECLSNSRKHCLSYCEDCPLERSKLEDAKEGCKGHLLRNFIKECWWKCGCNANCGNRVVQRGIRRNLQVFMTSKGKGWGLRTLEDLPKGAFVCEFVGEILTSTELSMRVSQTSNSATKYEFPVLLDSDWSERAMKNEEALCLDSVNYGNLARFINHRCFDANLVGIPVEVDTPEHHYYRFALFTTRKVDTLEELTRDYGTDFDDHGDTFKTFQCLCESKHCRNLRRKTRSRSAKKRG